MKLFLIIPAFLICEFVLSQKTRLICTEREATSGLIFRGKALAAGVLEDTHHMNLTAGFEYRFKNYHAIGLDYVYMRGVSDYEEQDTATGYYSDNGFHDFDKRRYLLFDYRFYLNFNRSRSTWLPYINLFTKQGSRTMWYQEGSHFNRTEPLFHRSWFQEYGMALGAHFDFTDNGFGADLSLGYIRAFQNVFYQDPNRDWSINEFGLDALRPWKMHMRVNLYWYIFKKKS